MRNTDSPTVQPPAPAQPSAEAVPRLSQNAEERHKSTILPTHHPSPHSHLQLLTRTQGAALPVPAAPGRGASCGPWMDPAGKSPPSSWVPEGALQPGTRLRASQAGACGRPGRPRAETGPSRRPSARPRRGSCGARGGPGGACLAQREDPPPGCPGRACAQGLAASGVCSRGDAERNRGDGGGRRGAGRWPYRQNGGGLQRDGGPAAARVRAAGAGEGSRIAWRCGRAESWRGAR